jgi:hypothetical protein
MFFLPEEQTGEAWETSKNIFLFGNWETLERKVQ